MHKKRRDLLYRPTNTEPPGLNRDQKLELPSQHIRLFDVISVMKRLNPHIFSKILGNFPDEDVRYNNLSKNNSRNFECSPRDKKFFKTFLILRCSYPFFPNKVSCCGDFNSVHAHHDIWRFSEAVCWLNTWLIKSIST